MSVSYIDKEIKGAIANELDSIKLSSELKSKIMLKRTVEMEKIQKKRVYMGRIFIFLRKLLNYEIEINFSYALAVLLIVMIVSLGYVRTEAKNLKNQKINILEGRIEASWQVDGK